MTSTSSTSSNVFQDVLTNARAAEEKYFGQTYPYYKYVQTPAQMGMSGAGNLNQLGKDIDGLVNYVELLVAGTGKASATGQPLGNRFFINTGGKCKDVATGQEQDRYMYIDNVPHGNIPLISSGAGVNFTEMRGLIPGTLSNLNAFNPITIFQAFLEGTTPPCQALTLETIDASNARSAETHYVTTVDISNMDPCSFPDKRNPVTQQGCKETFQSAAPPLNVAPLSPSSIAQLSLVTCGAAVGLGLVYLTLRRAHMIPS